MKILHKAHIAGAVMLATAGVAVGTAQAESLLAPLIINSSVGDGNPLNNIETFLSMRTGSSLTVDEDGNSIHYRWIQKNHPDTAPADGYDDNDDGEILNVLHDLDRSCKMVDSYGKATPRDMIYQSTAGDGDFKALHANYFNDDSSPSGFPGNFVGMLVVDAMGTKEGNFSGFAYVVNTGEGTLLDYKLLNNHHSTDTGNFAAGFISKKSIDYSWLPTTLVDTQWYTAVTSKTMGEEVEVAGVYDATVTIGNAPRVELDGTSNQQSPTEIAGGIRVFDHDENHISSAPNFNVTCLGLYDRTKLVDPSQVNFTAGGGWARRSITPVAGTKIAAKGAITYRWETANDALKGLMNGKNAATFQVETSGNLSKRKSHANKPY